MIVSRWLVRGCCFIWIAVEEDIMMTGGKFLKIKRGDVADKCSIWTRTNFPVVISLYNYNFIQNVLQMQLKQYNTFNSPIEFHI